VTPLDFSGQIPFSGTDVAAVIFGTLSAIFLVLWLRDREPGASWIALGYGFLAIHFFNDASLRPNTVNMNPVAAALHGMAAASCACGLLQYFAAPGRASNWLIALATVPSLAITFCATTGIPLPRPWAFFPYMLTGLIIVYAAFSAALRERSSSHALTALGIVLMPVYLVWQVANGAETFTLRYYALIPEIFLGIAVLTVSLVRRRVALEIENARRMDAEHSLTILNASLEATIASRTADLQNIVAGLESFNRNVSHDLRGSLGGIAGLANVANDALRQGDTAVARRVLPLIAGQAQQSSDLVTALLTLAKVGDKDLHKSHVDLTALAHEAIALAEAQTGNQMALFAAASARRDVATGTNGVSATSTNVARLPNSNLRAPLRHGPSYIVGDLPVVEADPSLLRPALANLIGNAIKFCGHRPDACIEVLASRDDEQTVVQVRDNGVGFCRENARVLFQPFTRLHGHDYAGHGIGLSIVRRAVERHGGRVWAEAAPDEGASFYFSLPNAGIEALSITEPLASAAE
jgi:signal transduction histidine kinase